MTHPDTGELIATLERTLQLMATCASVPMNLWDEHSNACLQAVSALRSGHEAERMLAEADTVINAMCDPEPCPDDAFDALRLRQCEAVNRHTARQQDGK